jgi:hypothetical protein
VATPPSDTFDACRAWLGIDRADLADPRRVLGLVPGEVDPIVVLRAAETRLKALKGLAAGPHHAAREALILQVEQAREKVLSQIAAAGGSGAAKGGQPSSTPGFRMPPPPRRADATTADADGATVVFDEQPGTATTGDPAFTPPLVRVRQYRPSRRQGAAAIWISLLAMLGSVAAGVAFIWWQAKQQEIRQTARNQAQRRDDEGSAVAADEPKVATAKPLPEDAAISSSPPPVRRAGTKPSGPPAARESSPPSAVASMSKGRASAEMDTDEQASDPTPAPPDPEPMAEPASEPADEPAADTMADADAPADEEPSVEIMDAADGDGAEAMPEAIAEGDPAPDTTADADAEAAIVSALAALRGGDFDTADALLASALEAGRSVPSKRRIADWQVLAGYAREFTGFREKAIAEVRPGNEFDVNGKKVAVVEIDDKKFIYRFQGRNKTTPRDKIPAGIGMAIVTTWFDERPANHLFLGAHHATKPEPDLAKARDHWERAEKGGINAEPLLRLLDDPVIAAKGAADETAEE